MRGSGKIRGGNKGKIASGLPPVSSATGSAATGPVALGELVSAVALRLQSEFPRIRVSKSPAAPLSGGDDRSRRE